MTVVCVSVLLLGVKLFFFLNFQLQYLHLEVTELKSMWQEAIPGQPWDLSVESLRQVETWHSEVVNLGKCILKVPYYANLTVPGFCFFINNLCLHPVNDMRKVHAVLHLLVPFVC